MNTPNAQLTTALSQVRLQTLESLTGNDFDSRDDFGGMFAQALLSQVPDMRSVTVGVLSSLIGPANGDMMGFSAMPPLHAGRNMTLADPESAYRMMTLINGKEVLYQAQRYELGRMGGEVAKMHEEGERLAKAATDGGDIKAAVQRFVDQYNGWMQGFRQDMQGGGLLVGTQAAEVSRYELEQSVRWRFHGASEGLHGMADLGVSVGADGLLALDAARLDATLQSNPKGAVAVLNDFGSNFAKSAELLNKSDNFIPRQLDNLDRAINYIGQNHRAWQAEFGMGDAARPTGQVAEALAAYRHTQKA